MENAEGPDTQELSRLPDESDFFFSFQVEIRCLVAEIYVMISIDGLPCAGDARSWQPLKLWQCFEGTASGCLERLATVRLR